MKEYRKEGKNKGKDEGKKRMSNYPNYFDGSNYNSRKAPNIKREN